MIENNGVADIELCKMKLKEYRSLVRCNPNEKTGEIRIAIRKLEAQLKASA